MLSTVDEPRPASAPGPGETEASREIAQRQVPVAHAVEVMPLMTDREISRAWRTATALAKSRMFKDVTQAEQAFAKILIGRDLGISPTQAMMGIDLVKGNVQLRGVLLASFIRKHPGYHYRVPESTHEKARVQFLGFPQDEPEDGFVRSADRWWEVLGEEEFTVADAKRAGLVKPGGAWEAHPKNMCVWRCISNGVKFFMPDLLAGMPVYVEGELDEPRPVTQPAGASLAREPELPERLAVLVGRARQIDPTVWRVPDIAGRLPAADDASLPQVVERIAAEIEQWLSEREPVDAQVVEEHPEQEEASEPAVEALSPEGLAERWQADQEWRARVEPLLHQLADFEAEIDEARAQGDEATVEHVSAAYGETADALAALGVPLGWRPEEPATTEGTLL